MEINNLVFAFFDSDGPGGVVILVVLLLACGIYYVLTRWILAGGKKAHSHQQPINEILTTKEPGSQS